MATRRGFVTGVLAAGLAPRASWADAGNPSYLAAAKLGDGSFRLVGLTADGNECFRLPMPGRGHAAAAHPSRPDAVAFARRPGRFALVIDCRDGSLRAQLESPEGRHFYGHGAFSADGSLLFTTENDWEAARGVVGIWDVAAGYERVDEIPSGGVGPHEILRTPDGGFAVANGGIATRPESGEGREGLNVPTMAPNLAYLTASGSLAETVELAPELHFNSIRHLAVRADGLVAAAMQWEGDEAENPPLLILHRRGEAARLIEAPSGEHERMKGYAGSVAFSGDGTMVGITSPMEGLAQVFDPDTGEFWGAWQSPYLCGLAASSDGFAATTGTGVIAGLAGPAALWTRRESVAFDNHLVVI